MTNIRNNNNLLNLKFIKYQTILVCLLPLLLITGPAIPDILITILSISYLVYLIVNNKIRNQKIFK